MRIHLWLKQGFYLIVILLVLNTFIAAQQAPPQALTTAPEDSYRIRKGDKLSIKFLYQPELNEPSLLVRPDGFISLTLVNEIKAEGLTAAELRSVLERAYSESLVRPVITVSIIEFVPQRVFVGGQVNKAGSYEIRQGQTLLQAIILAGGFTREAHKKVVLHARPIGQQQLKVTVVDLTKLLKVDGKQEEVMLLDGDYIFVPDSKLSKINRIIEVFRSFVPGYGLAL